MWSMWEGSWEEQNEGTPESESMLCEENNVGVYCVAFLNSVSVGRKLEGHLILELIITWNISINFESVCIPVRNR